MKNKIISNIIINIIPLILTLFHYYIDLNWNFTWLWDFLLTLNYSNSLLISSIFLSFENSLITSLYYLIIISIIIVIYNYFVISLFYNISEFIRKNIIIFTTIFSIFSSLIWFFYFGINLSI